MSAIDPNVPTDQEPRSQGASRIREHRTWLEAFANAFLVRHQGTGLDPALWPAGFKVIVDPPPTPVDGDFYVTSSNQCYGVSGGVATLRGDLAKNTETVFRQATAPPGWTRNTSLPAGSGLRYVTGSLSTGGTVDVAGVLSHGSPTGSYDSTFAQISVVRSIADHPVLKYVDVLLAVRG